MEGNIKWLSTNYNANAAVCTTVMPLLTEHILYGHKTYFQLVLHHERFFYWKQLLTQNLISMMMKIFIRTSLVQIPLLP